MSRFFFGILFVALGCTYLMSSEANAAGFDYETGYWIKQAEGVAVLRTTGLEEGGEVAAALKAQCQDGIITVVLLPARAQRTSKAVAGSCVQVYVANAAWGGPDVVLVDGHILVVGGYIHATNNEKVTAEDMYQRSLAAVAMRIQ